MKTRAWMCVGRCDVPAALAVRGIGCVAVLSVVLAGCASTVRPPAPATDVRVDVIYDTSPNVVDAHIHTNGVRAGDPDDDEPDAEYVDHDYDVDSPAVVEVHVSVTDEPNPTRKASTARDEAASRTPGDTPSPKPAATALPDRSDPLASALDRFHASWAGVRYRWGGDSRKGIDCSALVRALYQTVFDHDLPRTTVEQVGQGVEIPRTALRPGDLVFFRLPRGPRHVGVYYGGGRFLHASRSSGVRLSILNRPYWRRYFWKAVRIAGRQVAAVSTAN